MKSVPLFVGIVAILTLVRVPLAWSSCGRPGQSDIDEELDATAQAMPVQDVVCVQFWCKKGSIFDTTEVKRGGTHYDKMWDRNINARHFYRDDTYTAIIDRFVDNFRIENQGPLSNTDLLIFTTCKSTLSGESRIQAHVDRLRKIEAENDRERRENILEQNRLAAEAWKEQKRIQDLANDPKQVAIRAEIERRAAIQAERQKKLDEKLQREAALKLKIEAIKEFDAMEARQRALMLTEAQKALKAESKRKAEEAEKLRLKLKAENEAKLKAAAEKDLAQGKERDLVRLYAARDRLDRDLGKLQSSAKKDFVCLALCQEGAVTGSLQYSQSFGQGPNKSNACEKATQGCQSKPMVYAEPTLTNAGRKHEAKLAEEAKLPKVAPWAGENASLGCRPNPDFGKTAEIQKRYDRVSAVLTGLGFQPSPDSEKQGFAFEQLDQVALDNTKYASDFQAIQKTLVQLETASVVAERASKASDYAHCSEAAHGILSLYVSLSSQLNLLSPELRKLTFKNAELIEKQKDPSESDPGKVYSNKFCTGNHGIFYSPNGGRAYAAVTAATTGIRGIMSGVLQESLSALLRQKRRSRLPQGICETPDRNARATERRESPDRRDLDPPMDPTRHSIPSLNPVGAGGAK